MSRTTKVQMAIEDASDWDDGTLEDYIVNLEAENKVLKSRVDELEDIVSTIETQIYYNWEHKCYSISECEYDQAMDRIKNNEEANDE